MKKTFLKNYEERGITLIALIITIIIMLILVAVTISMAINGGLFEYAGKAVSDTQNAIYLEQELANGKIQIGEKWYASLDDYIKDKPIVEPTREDFFVIYEQTGKITIAQDTSENHDGIGYYYNGSQKILSEENVVIPNTINGIEVKTIMGKVYGGGFLRATNLKSVVIPDTVTKIESGAFSYCTSLEKVTLPNNITTIEMEIFDGCTSLKEINIPNKVTEIKSMAFNKCTSLKEITIPKSVTSISSTAFYWCDNLTKIIIENGSTLTVPIGKWGATNATIEYK